MYELHAICVKESEGVASTRSVVRSVEKLRRLVQALHGSDGYIVIEVRSSTLEREKLMDLLYNIYTCDDGPVTVDEDDGYPD